ncbi:MAG TPA: MCE family protein [Marmoricola sp.]|jgi:phospholipid/cholesterol/gamma-HCH transport system substrate-binding protein|nr:MCE family protein [Marmoricola sp.]
MAVRKLSRSVRPFLVAALVLLLTAAVLVFTRGPSERTATLHFARTVSVYPGTEVRVMGVQIGEVTSVVPQGDNVKVEIAYDDHYQLPAAAKAAIVTPTLVADRFVQVVPAYTGGPTLADGADVPLARTGTPVELDEIYRSLSDLTVALGPKGANKDGSLDALLHAGAKALDGNGALGNRTIKDLSAAVGTFGDNSGELFSSVQNLSQLTRVLAANDQFVSRFMGDLSSVSAQLSGDRGELAQALAALARAMGTVRSFVKDNRAALVSDVRGLTDILGIMAKEKESLDTVARLSALGLGNLTLGFDSKTGTQGSRVQFTPMLYGLPDVMCDIVVNSGQFPGRQAKTVCTLLNEILKPVVKSLPRQGFPGLPAQQPLPGLDSQAPPKSLAELLGALGGGGS